MQKAESEANEKYKSDCISRYGQQKGVLVSQKKVEAGMTAEMCKASWGAPWDSLQTATPSGTKEIWLYNWKYKLHFANGILVKIEH